MIFLSKDSYQVRNTEEKGRGLFATKKIKAGIIVGDYLGKIIKTKDYDFSKDKDGVYLMYYSDYASICPSDLNSTDLHLINHSCNPNCFMQTYKGHTLFITLRKISANEELTVSYKFAPRSKLDDPCPHMCKCGFEKCTGTMHLTEKEYIKWRKFSEKEYRKYKLPKIKYGEELAPLKKYPNRNDILKYAKNYSLSLV
ncbi:SET domain-containing protein-lysine N-methyltransferase [soil metagenome]